MNEQQARIVETIEREDDFLISTHLYPDGDAVASELALYQTLRKLGKKATIINASPLSDQYDFLPFRDAIITLDRYQGNGRFRTLLSLDCGRDYRLGDVLPRLQPDQVINIDHHISNNYFGHINLVRPEACSTGELILDLAVALGVEIDLDIAICVYTAIVSDTGRFCYKNTTPRSHEILARMIALGVDPPEITGRLYRSRTLGQLRINSLLIDTLELSDDGRVAWAELTNSMCDAAAVSMIETLDCVRIPISLRGVQVGLLFRETDPPGEVKLSLRSEGDIDVSSIARRFGGGGHPGAAGCSFEGSLAEVRERIIPAVLGLLPAS